MRVKMLATANRVRGWLVPGIVGAAMAFALTATYNTVTAQTTTEFTGPAGIIIANVKGANAADYEAVMAKVKEALSMSDEAAKQRMGQGWKIYRQVERQGGNVTYIHVIDPVVSGGDYTVGNILNVAFPAEVQALYQQFADSLVGGLSRANLEPLN